MLSKRCFYENNLGRGPDWVPYAVNPTRTKRDQMKQDTIDFISNSPARTSLGAGGRRFESCCPDQLNQDLSRFVRSARMPLRNDGGPKLPSLAESALGSNVLRHGHGVRDTGDWAANTKCPPPIHILQALWAQHQHRSRCAHLWQVGAMRSVVMRSVLASRREGELHRRTLRTAPPTRWRTAAPSSPWWRVAGACPGHHEGYVRA